MDSEFYNELDHRLLAANNTDHTCDRADIGAVYYDQILLPLAGWLSVISYLVILYLYFWLKVPTLKRHPTSLGVRKCIFELIFVSQYLWIPFVDQSFFWSDEGSCRASLRAGIFAFITQFSLIGSELWFLVLAMDLQFACTNPFTSYKLYAQRYEIFVFSVSFGTACVLVMLGPSVYGLSSDMNCWIQSTDSREEDDDDNEGNSTSNFPASKIILFYVWMLGIYSYSVYVVWLVFRRLKKGVSDVLSARLSTVRRAQIYVLGYTLGYTLYWIFPFIFSLLDFMRLGNHRAFRTLSAFFLAIRGVFSVVILLYPNWADMKSFFEAKNAKATDGLVQNIVAEDLSQRPHLNTVLRAEIIYFTTLGIRHAAKQMAPVERGSNQIDDLPRNTTLSRQASARTSQRKSSSRFSGISALSEDVRVYSCSKMSRESAMDTAGDDLNRLTGQQRESISLSGLMSDELEKSLDMVGVYGGRQDRSMSSRESPLTPKKDTSGKMDVENPIQTREMVPMGAEGSDSPLSARERIKQNFLSAASQAKEVFSPSKRTQNDYIFRDYLPHYFAEVREKCNIDGNEYAASFENITKEKFSEGRSGAFLYFSSDQKYIVKTTTKDEISVLLDMMQEYLSHMIANPNSLIVRFLGAHSLTMYNQDLYFVVMLNVFSKANLSERYDLKGSWVARHGDTLQRRDTSKSAPLYKDNDLQHKISLDPGVANALHDQIFRDSSFLSGLGLMDYSLLVGVVQRKFEVMERPTSHPDFPEDESVDMFLRDEDGGMHATVVEGPGTYYMGIIDILQYWNFEKKVERFLKIFFKWEDGNGLSAIDPQRYADRFMKRCVVEVFEGLIMDKNPKNRHNLPKSFQSADSADSSSHSDSILTDRRFSAAPIAYSPDNKL